MCFFLFWELCSWCLDQGTALQFAYVLSATAVLEGPPTALPYFCCYIQSLQLCSACITLHDLYAFSPGSSRSLQQRAEMQQLGCCVVPTLSIPTLSLKLYLQGVELCLCFQAGWNQCLPNFEFFLQSGLWMPWPDHSLIQAMDKEGHYGFRFRHPLLALA